MNQHKNSMKMVTVEISPELHERHMIAADKIIDIVFEYCDGPPDALFLLKKLTEKLCQQFGMLDAIEELGSDKLQ